MRRDFLCSAAIAAALALPTAALAVPATVPVQGVLQDADGAPIAEELPVVFNLYADADGQALVWTEERQVSFDRGFFSVDLGSAEPLDAGLFRDSAAGLWLGVAVDGDDEMALVAIGTAPFAGFAEYAGQAAAADSAAVADTATTADDAATVGGISPDDLSRVGHTHAFADLEAIPADLADGDDDTTYAAGDGLALADGTFSLQTCDPGQVLATGDAGWACADGDGPAVGAELLGTELIVTDGESISVVDLAALVADDDADPANELLIGAALDGSTLVLTDAGGESRVDLAALVPDGALTVTGARLEGSTLTLARGDDPADALTVDLGPLVADDDDRDPANELLLGAALDGTALELTDGGGVTAVDLAALVDDDDADPGNELLTGAALDGTTLTIDDAGGQQAVDLASLVEDDDADPGNELLTGAALEGTTLTIDDAGGQQAVDLASLVDDDDADPGNELLTGAALDGTTLTIDDAGGQQAVDLASLVEDDDADPTNELLTAAGLNGTVLSLEDAGGQRRIDLASLVEDDDADPGNEYLTGAALEGTVLTLEDGGGQREVELASLASDPQTLGFDNSSGALTISDGNSVNVYENTFVLSSNLGNSQDDIAFADTFNGDDTGQSIALPFTVSYGGVGYTRVWLSSNGWLEFQTIDANLGSDLSNDALPTAAHSGPFVAAYWDDLITTISYETAGTAPNRVFTAYWTGDTFSGDHVVNFTVQIHETSGVITVRYFTMAPGANGQDATIGFQTAGAGNAKAYPLGANVKVLDDNLDDADPGSQGWSVTPLR